MTIATSFNIRKVPYDPADQYEGFSKALNIRFQSLGGDHDLFTTDAVGIFERYLRNLSSGRRQHYNCRTCQKFLDDYGGLVLIDDRGIQIPALWHSSIATPFFRDAVDSIVESVAGAKVTGVFLSEDQYLGTPATHQGGCEYHHLYVRQHPDQIHKNRIKTAHQAMAEKTQDFHQVIRSINRYDYRAVRQVVEILQSDTVFRSEKILGPARWFHDVVVNFHDTHGKAKTNLVWRAVASAPPGFAHVNTSVLGTLLEDIQAGKSIADVIGSFRAKMQPDQYQRPQAPPKAGNIRDAEKLVAKLGIEKSLERRYAGFGEVTKVWKARTTGHPGSIQPAGTGVFAGVKSRDSVKTSDAFSTGLKHEKMTWAKFQRTILPHVKKITYLVPHGREAFAAYMTAVHPDAPPILQWDLEGNRNPFSWYLYMNGSSGSSWNLKPGQYVDVRGISLKPSMWHPESRLHHHGVGALFILDGCRDLNYRSAGSGLFPEILKSELHGIRAVIEQYSKQQVPGDPVDATACGIMFEGRNPVTIRVHQDRTWQDITIDRWDLRAKPREGLDIFLGVSLTRT